MLKFTEVKKDQQTGARTGIIERGGIQFNTPLYVFAGTDATVRTLDKTSVNEVKALIANTYHLGVRTNKDKEIALAGGLAEFMGFKGLTFTDSGGFQVFSYGKAREFGVGKLAPLPGETVEQKVENNLVVIKEDGVLFREPTLGKEIFLDAKMSISIQERLKSDIMMAFDECTSPLDSYAYTKNSLERTNRWLLESLAAREGEGALFGIIQGGYFKDLRKQSAGFILQQEIDGVALGGSFGTDEGGIFDVASWIRLDLEKRPELPRHFLGIGLPEDIFKGVEAGMDTFDCVIPTREARHGSVYTRHGRVDLKKGLRPEDSKPIETGCLCRACQKYSRQELKEMLKSENPYATRIAELLTLHNVEWWQNLMSEIRQAILEDRFLEFKKNGWQNIKEIRVKILFTNKKSAFGRGFFYRLNKIYFNNPCP